MCKSPLLNSYSECLRQMVNLNCRNFPHHWVPAGEDNLVADYVSRNPEQAWNYEGLLRRENIQRRGTQEPLSENSSGRDRDDGIKKAIFQLGLHNKVQLCNFERCRVGSGLGTGLQPESCNPTTYV